MEHLRPALRPFGGDLQRPSDARRGRDELDASFLEELHGERCVGVSLRIHCAGRRQGASNEMWRSPSSSWGLDPKLQGKDREDGRGWYRVKLREPIDRHERPLSHQGVETSDPIATLKLEKRILTSNMHLFASDGKIKKFSSARSDPGLLSAPSRSLRAKASLTHRGCDVLARSLDAKARFILAVCEGRIDLRRPEKEVIERLVELDLPDHMPLLSMKLSSLNAERVEELKKQRDDAIESLEKLRATLPETMWRRDLDALEAHFASSSAPSSTKRQKKE